MEEVKRTVKVKLDLTDNAKHLLHQTAKQFNTAVNYTLNNAKKTNGYYRDTKKELHDKVYYDLREQTELPANLCVRAYSKALEMINSTIEDWSKATTVQNQNTTKTLSSTTRKHSQ